LNSVVLREEVRQQLDTMQGADILVGIPSYNNAKTIGHVVRAVQAGFAKYFPGQKCILVNSDGGSTDGTADVVRDTTIEDFQSVLLHHRVAPMFKIATPYHGIPGKGSAFRTIFEIAEMLDVKACAVVDSDLRSITPEWIELLLKPVMSGDFDYVSPLYLRHKYDGTITNSIVYPLTRTLYGKRIRQPIGGDFGFSGRLAKFYLTKNVWESDVARYGIDIWMTTTAVANDFRVSQAFLGAKIHDPKDPGADLSAMLFQVAGAAFDLMDTYADVWKNVRSSSAVPTFGFRYAVGVEPVNVNVDAMIERFRLGVRELGDIWRLFLPEATVASLNHASTAPKKNFVIPDEQWVDIIYAFARASHERVLNREHLLKSLTPLYIGRVASFVRETWESDSDEVEERIERLCGVFEERKHLLLENWA
jgi:glycosyltransferase involved in cell wall biosynthesis